MQREAQIYTPANAPESLYIRQIWRIQDPDLAVREEKILPKGTAEIIFNLSAGIQAKSAGLDPPSLLPECFINGLNSKPYHLLVHARQYFVGVQMHLFALRYLFRAPVAEFNNQILEGELLCKSLPELTAQLAATANFQTQVEAIVQWFRKKLAQSSATEPDARVLQLNADSGLLAEDIAGLAAKYNLTPRHLSRLCNEHFGQATEETILYRKYLAALNLVHHSQEPLTDVALSCGFYDQPHFSRTFRQFTGLSARDYRKEKSELPGHLFHFPGV